MSSIFVIPNNSIIAAAVAYKRGAPGQSAFLFLSKHTLFEVTEQFSAVSSMAGALVCLPSDYVILPVSMQSEVELRLG